MSEPRVNVQRPFRMLASLACLFVVLFAAWSWAVFHVPAIDAFDREIAQRFAEMGGARRGAHDEQPPEPAVDDAPPKESPHSIARPARRSTLRTFMVAATHSGGIRANLLIALGGSFWMWRHHRRRFAIAWLVISCLGGLMVLELKELFNRDRPPIEWRDPAILQENESYPSGHATGSLIGYGMLGFVLLQRIKSKPARVAVAGLLIAWVFTIGLSRVYLRAHWTSDILGGWLLGLAYTTTCLAIYFWRKRTVNAIPIRIDEPIVQPTR